MDIESRLLPVTITRHEYANAVYFLEVGPEIMPAHIVNPEFWQHLAAKFKVNDEVTVVASDGSFDATLRVVAIDVRPGSPSWSPLWAKMRLLRICSDTGIRMPNLPSVASRPAVDSEGYLVEPDGLGKWRIVRDRDLISTGFSNESEAKEALANLKAAARPKKVA